jgi:raffinose/stachyose/melibiose transport system permease protein
MSLQLLQRNVPLRFHVTGHRASRLVLMAAAFVSMAPLLLVMINALKPNIAIVRDPLSLPHGFDLNNFREAWIQGGFSVGLLNSLLLSGSTIVITVSLAAMAAYPLARRRIRAWQLITLYFLCSVTLPIQLFLFPLYFVYAKLGMVGNVFATSLILLVSLLSLMMRPSWMGRDHGVFFGISFCLWRDRDWSP